MAFHLGVLRYLAEKGMLERVSRVSTVSGGSLLVGLMMCRTGLRWPLSDDFKAEVFDRVRADMCHRSLMWAAVRQLLRPWNWGYVLSRADLVAKALHSWGVTYALEQLPQLPEWSINGTTAENGRRFRFKRDTMGDWQFGYAKGGSFPLARAMAVSAAFPGGIGPLSLKTGSFQWKRRASWHENAPEEDVILPFKRLRLYDGGVYDNLGLEPYFDVGRRQSKIRNLAIYVSDAGAPLAVGKLAGPLSPWRVKRLADIMSEQSRTLRVRSFYSYIDDPGLPLGAYAYIATKVPGGNDSHWNVARSFPTSLARLTTEQFDAIAAHGYAVAREIERQHGFLARFTRMTSELG